MAHLPCVRVLVGSLGLSLFVVACSDEPIEVPEGSAGYEAGQVIAPGAQIIVAGRQGEGTLEIESTDLIGLEKDGRPTPNGLSLRLPSPDPSPPRHTAGQHPATISRL